MRNRIPLIAGIIGLFVFLLIGLTVVLPRISLPSTPTETDEEMVSELDSLPPPDEKIITLTENGFEPVSITVKVGDQVVFRNATSEPASINSNPYPVNNLYKMLNLGEFSPDSTVAVIFDKPGSYSYHNHFIPEQQGTILVKE